MEIRQREIRQIIILDLSGRFVLEDGVDAFLELMNALIRGGRRQILVNFEGVTYLDSAAVGAIAGKYVTAQKRGGDVKLLHLGVRSFTVLEKTRLLTVISSYDSEDAAIASFETESSDDDDIDPIFT
jgi:anti-sigma B factor antagonist